MDNASCRKPSVLNSALCCGQAPLFRFSRLDSLQTYTNRNATPLHHIPHHRWRKGTDRETEGGKKNRGIGTYIHEIISNTDLPRPIQGHYRIHGREHPVLTLFKTASDWLRIRVICQHYFQTHSPARITTKLGFPLRIRRRKSTQITQYNLYA